MNALTNLLAPLGAIVLFVGEIIRTAVRTPSTPRQFSEQIWKVTVQSLPTTTVAGFFVGAIMTVQFTVQIKTFGALGYLGGLSTSATVREIGPLLIAFLLSGKVGAFTSAELATMRVTEQIDAIRCLGADPIREIVVPRFFGIVVSSFLLLIAGLATSILGGMILAALFSGINAQEYLRHLPTIVTGFSIACGLFKCLVFALILASVCSYQGFFATGGARGVGRAVVQTAVITMVGIVVSDWVTTILAQSALLVLGGDRI